MPSFGGAGERARRDVAPAALRRARATPLYETDHVVVRYDELHVRAEDFAADAFAVAPPVTGCAHEMRLEHEPPEVQRDAHGSRQLGIQVGSEEPGIFGLGRNLEHAFE